MTGGGRKLRISLDSPWPWLIVTPRVVWCWQQRLCNTSTYAIETALLSLNIEYWQYWHCRFVMPLRTHKVIQYLFRQDSLAWLDRSYTVDWYVALFYYVLWQAHIIRLIVLSFWVLSVFASAAPVFERSFDLHDPLISYPHGKDQYVLVSQAFIELSFIPNLLELAQLWTTPSPSGYRFLLLSLSAASRGPL